MQILLGCDERVVGRSRCLLRMEIACRPCAGCNTTSFAAMTMCIFVYQSLYLFGSTSGLFLTPDVVLAERWRNHMQWELYMAAVITVVLVLRLLVVRKLYMREHTKFNLSVYCDAVAQQTAEIEKRWRDEEMVEGQ
ncbi:hypothetical protein Tco_0464879 [Tanacetum coccineum]